MRGQLPSSTESGKKTSLLITWLSVDRGLLEALRPFKARARGRRLKELATLGAEAEKLGFRLECSEDGYRLLAPAMPASLHSGITPTVSAQPAAAPDSLQAQLPSHDSTGASIAQDVVVELKPPVPVDEDVSEFAAGFM